MLPFSFSSLTFGLFAALFLGLGLSIITALLSGLTLFATTFGWRGRDATVGLSVLDLLERSLDHLLEAGDAGGAEVIGGLLPVDLYACQHWWKEVRWKSEGRRTALVSVMLR